VRFRIPKTLWENYLILRKTTCLEVLIKCLRSARRRLRRRTRGVSQGGEEHSFREVIW